MLRRVPKPALLELPRLTHLHQQFLQSGGRKTPDLRIAFRPLQARATVSDSSRDIGPAASYLHQQRRGISSGENMATVNTPRGYTSAEAKSADLPEGERGGTLRIKKARGVRFRS